MKYSLQKREGFTIVELLVVIVVIGVLAAITIIAFNGIKQRATETSLISDLRSGISTLHSLKSMNSSEQYPADLTAADLKKSPGNTYEYSVDNTVSPATFCVTVTNGSTSYYVSDKVTTPTRGGCPGHSVGGIAPITNLVTDPKLADDADQWVTTFCTEPSSRVSVSDLPGISYAYQFGDSGPTTNCRALLTGINLAQNQYHAFSMWAKAPAGHTLKLEIFNGTGSTLLQSSANVVTNGSWQRFWVGWNNGTTASVRVGIRKLGNTGPVTILATGGMVYQAAAQYAYADGDSPGWSWSGTANSSTSSGVPTSN